MSTTPTSRPAWVTMLFDLVSYFGGWSLIGYQALMVPPKDVNEWFLLLGGSMIGVPGVAEILAWRGRQSSGGTAAPDSSSPPPDSPRPASSSTSTT